MRTSTAESLINDLPKGPLEVYRRRATFDWKSLKLTFDGEDFVQFQVLWKTDINIFISLSLSFFLIDNFETIKLYM